MKNRLPDGAMGYKSLLPLTESMGTVANIYSHEITELSDNVRREDTAWMVSKKLAKAWQVFVTKERD